MDNPGFWIPVLIGVPILAFKIVLIIRHLQSSDKVTVSETDMDAW